MLDSRKKYCFWKIKKKNELVSISQSWFIIFVNCDCREIMGWIGKSPVLMGPKFIGLDCLLVAIITLTLWHGSPLSHQGYDILRALLGPGRGDVLIMWLNSTEIVSEILNMFRYCLLIFFPKDFGKTLKTFPQLHISLAYNREHRFHLFSMACGIPDMEKLLLIYWAIRIDSMLTDMMLSYLYTVR